MVLLLILKLKRNNMKNREVHFKEQYDFSKTPEEKEAVSIAKSQYKAKLRSHFGSNWKTESRRQCLYNPTDGRF
jgi:hypothetical protein